MAVAALVPVQEMVLRQEAVAEVERNRLPPELTPVKLAAAQAQRQQAEQQQDVVLPQRLRRPPLPHGFRSTPWMPTRLCLSLLPLPPQQQVVAVQVVVVAAEPAAQEVVVVRAAEAVVAQVELPQLAVPLPLLFL